MSEGLDKRFWLVYIKISAEIFSAFVKFIWKGEEENEKDCKDVAINMVWGVSVVCVGFLPILRDRFWPGKILQRRTY